jgi:hypothetical protein
MRRVPGFEREELDLPLPRSKRLWDRAGEGTVSQVEVHLFPFESDGACIHTSYSHNLED